MFDFLYKSPKGKHDIIKNTVEDESEIYLERISRLKTAFIFRSLRNA